MKDIDNDINNEYRKRSKAIVKASIIGIFTNILLVCFKATIGFFTNSIAIILDAVNNLSDVLSSIITIIGTKLSEKEPDKEHPLGHGRIEYLSAMIIASIILYAGITSLVESVKKVINPSVAEYNNTSLIIISVSVVIKIFLGKYVKNIGEKYDSQSLVASGKDALFDSLISLSVLASALIFIFYKISLEAYVGVIISIVIIRAGIETLTEAIDDILGKRVDKELIKQIKNTICTEHGVTGAYDLILHSYGPKKYIGSVHIEVPEDMTADKIDLLERKITDNIYKKYGVLLTGISIYSVNEKDSEIIEMHLNILKITMLHPDILQVHAFYVNKDEKTMRFDMIIDFASENKEQILEEVRIAIKKEYPDYEIYIKMDIDI